MGSNRKYQKISDTSIHLTPISEGGRGTIFEVEEEEEEDENEYDEDEEKGLKRDITVEEGKGGKGKVYHV